MNIKKLNESLELILNEERTTPGITMEFDGDNLYCEVAINKLEQTVVVIEDEGNRFKIWAEVDPAGLINEPGVSVEYITKYVDKNVSLNELKNKIINVAEESINVFDLAKQNYGTQD